MSSVEIVEVGSFKRNRPKVITGFAGAGFVGNTAIMHIVREKGLKLRAQVRSHMIPAMMLLVDGEPTHPFRIYGDEGGELLFVSNAVLISPENAWPLGLKLMEWLTKAGVREIVAIEGMPFAIQPGERPIYGFGVPARDLNQFGVSPIREGGVSGLNAVMLEESMKQSIPFVTLMVPTPFASAIDYGAAIPVVEVLNKMFKLGVDVTTLKERAEMVRKSLERTGAVRRRGFLSSLRGSQPT